MPYVIAGKRALQAPERGLGGDPALKKHPMQRRLRTPAAGGRGKHSTWDMLYSRSEPDSGAQPVSRGAGRTSLMQRASGCPTRSSGDCRGLNSHLSLHPAPLLACQAPGLCQRACLPACLPTLCLAAEHLQHGRDQRRLGAYDGQMVFQ